MKKKILITISFLIILLFSPYHSLAHGGVEKRAGNILVTLFQSPLSPLVGEKVIFSFIITDKDANTRLATKSARLVITETTLGDESKDKVILTRSVVSDVNGVITFSDTFSKTNYYDIDLQFGKPNDEESTTGFLIQPRSLLTPQITGVLILLGISILFNTVLLISKMKKK